jgi:hypothetical protein
MEASSPTPDDEKVLIELTRPEALVLFELLARWNERGSGDIHLEHQAEQRVLWDIEATLESALVEPLMPDYQDRLAQARQRIKDSYP